MSADNGIYVLETGIINKEYRVAEIQAVENVDWDGNKHCYTDDQDIRIANAHRMWDSCEVFTDSSEAMNYAYNMEQNITNEDGFIPEHGVQIIRIPCDF